MARKPLRPLIRSGGFYPSRKWTPLVYAGGYTTANGGEEPTPPPIEKTIIGNPIHITDALAKPVQALSIALEPIQDLHGYDNPWPAGGGKNLFNIDRTQGTPNPADNSGSTSPREMDADHYYVGLTRDNYYAPTNVNSASVSGNTVNISSKNSGYGISFPVPVSANTQYTFSGVFTNAFVGFGYYDSEWHHLSYSSQYDSAITITTPADCAYVVCVIFTYSNETGSIANIQLEKGSTSTAWTPFSNLCPISGWTGAKVTRTGKNLCSQVLNGLISLGTDTAYFYTLADARSLVFECKAGQTYIASGLTMNRFVWGVFDSVPTNGSQPIAYQGYAQSQAFTPTKDGVCVLYVSNVPVDTSTAQIELGSTASAYSPYVGTTLPVSWQSEAGTVYAGYLSIDKDGGCTVTVDRVFVEFDGSVDETWYWHNSGVAFGAVSGGLITDATTQFEKFTLCDKLQSASWVGRGSLDNSCGMFFGASYVFIKVSNSITNVATARTWLSNNPITVIYPLATPVTYTLSSVTVPSTVQGENNIWSDGTMTLVYLADGNASDVEALNILLGGRYVNNHGEDEPTDREALDILLGGTR